ncbi:UNVERIFIED_CONTAM: Mitogen-activated protein kinase kinase kinase [Sesamum angustifolium]|uniref:Mitogen-activated protein kinase kinase kinase n=1 Tax=Sesamum angustifolium TaxID=2727405 RepID=A0AAW2NM18_9LAMI
MAVKSCGVSNSSSLVNERLVLEELRDCPEIIRCFGESSSYENGRSCIMCCWSMLPAGLWLISSRNPAIGGCQNPMSGSTLSLYSKGFAIHKVGFVHCDIKLQNILLGPNGGVKIADFGLAKRVGRKSAVPRCELRGTPMYMSPEMVGTGEQGAPADIWALGCVVAEMVAGAPAWRCSDVAGLLMRIGVGEEVPAIPGILSEEGKDFLGKCFVKNPSKRWTAEMLLNHPFVCDRDLDDAALKDRVENTASTSPRCPFDFPDWVSSATCSITSLPSPAQFPESGLWFCEESNFGKESWSISPAERLQELVSEQGPHWSVSDDWVTIR